MDQWLWKWRSTHGVSKLLFLDAPRLFAKYSQTLGCADTVHRRHRERRLCDRTTAGLRVPTAIVFFSFRHWHLARQAAATHTLTRLELAG